MEPSQLPIEPDFSPKSTAQWLSYGVRGALVGLGGILPGVSGGVLCVAFGIYKPLMEVLSNPFVGLPKHLKMLIPFVLGGALSFVTLAGLIGTALQNEALTVLVFSTFVGLILGTFPALFREAGLEGRTKQSWVALFCSSISLTTFFLFLKYVQEVSITPNLYWYGFCGALWGVGIIVPGMSTSPLLMFLGLYEPMSLGIHRFDLTVIIPMGIGLLVTVLALARAVQRLFNKHYSLTFHCILGFVISSTIPIIPFQFRDTQEFVFSIVLAVTGFFFAYYMDKWGNKIRPIGTTPTD